MEEHGSAKEEKTAALFARLLALVAHLRSPDGCPWDRRQTFESLAPYVVEEAHEVVEAIEAGDDAELCEELGDLMLEVALLAQIASETGRFTAADSLEAICRKLVRRHPHVFGEDRADGSGEDLDRRWARIKAAERGGRGVLEGVPRRLPALHRARRVSEKAAGVGFDWSSAGEVAEKVAEEWAELREAMRGDSTRRREEELGDLLFAAVNLGRHLGLDPEAALHRATDRFTARFRYVEERLEARQIDRSAWTLEEMESLWQEAKRSLADPQPPSQESAQPGCVLQADQASQPEVDEDGADHEPPQEQG